MKTRLFGRKFPAAPLALMLAGVLPLAPLSGQSAPASAPASAQSAPSTPTPQPAESASPAGETQFPLPPIPAKAAIPRGGFDETIEQKNNRVNNPSESPVPSPEPPPGSEANTITVPIRPAAQYAVKRAQILLAEERRDPALLMGLFQDNEAQIRARTARALGRIGYPGSAEVLAILLADPAPEVQAGAAWGALYLGKEAKPLIPDLRKVIAAGNAARLPALETLISLGDLDSAPLVLQAIQNNPDLRPQLAGHLFRIDTPAVRVMLKSWASNGRDLAGQTGALASLVRLKADDEPFYRDILAQSTGEPAVWAVKGLGLAKTPVPETITALESAAKREHDPMTRTEAFGQLSKTHYKDIVTELIKTEKLDSNDIQLMTAIYDGYNKIPCDQLEPYYPWVLGCCAVDDHKKPSASRDYKNEAKNGCYFWGACSPEYPSLDRRYRQSHLRCMKRLKEIEPYKDDRFRTKQSVAEMFAEYEGDEYNPKFLYEYAKDNDSRVRSSAAGALIQRGGSANTWLADKSAEVVANAADTASKIKPEEINPKRLSGAALMKAYQRFSLKKAEDGPNTRLYIVRAAAACAEMQPACLNVLKTALKDRVRTVQINAWERWPETLQKTRPEWPKPNLPRPDFLGAETRLQSLLANPPHFEVTTTKGKFTMLFTARGEAPLNVLNFRKLVAKRYFDGISWHRVVPNFVVQAGDPRGDGSGGPGWMIPCEYNSFPYRAGTVGMALDGKDSGGSQWFITLTAQPHLDYRYTVMGQVNSGLEVIYKLGEDDKIISIREIAYDPGATAIPNPPAESPAPPENKS